MKQKKSTEDYLKVIYLLSQKGEVRGTHIAEQLGVSRPTVSVALKGLEREGYILMNELRAVTLTEKGRAVAQTMVERHTTFRDLLMSLGIDKETASRDACEMEHSVSAESFEALKTMMVSRESALNN